MNALQPFAPDDKFVTASVLDESARFPTGQGRIRQYGADWQIKAELETGHTGLISALVLDPAGWLHALDPQARAITTVAGDGSVVEQFQLLPNRAYGSMIALGSGEYLLGEHMIGDIPGFSGEGKVYRVGLDGTVLATYNTETNGGMGGFLGVTHMALSHDAKTLYHTSETGAHVYAHDLVDDRRLGAVYTRQDPPPLVFGLAMLSDGDLILACGSELRRIDLASRTAQSVPLPEGRGWAVPIVRRSNDKQLWALDFFGGRVACIDTANNAVLELHELGLANCLTGIAEILA
jgi:sugar lactone lactonase YvrE